ncbi:MAG: DUF2177 family protein [Candidatus Aminicenantes bacterium]|nr:DUF2177 family protein [Candidatus Aminicenantes bacterium]
MILKYAILWVVSFIGISAVDALWHLVLWGRIYGRDIRKVAVVADGKLVFRNFSGALSQILVITAFVVLASLQFSSAKPYLNGIISCMMGGILSISVYGLVNHWIIRDWSLSVTVLESAWGPMIGAFAGFFIVWVSRLLKMN